MIADLILRYCKDNKLTQEQFAQRLGVSYTTLRRWLKKDKLPTRGENLYAVKHLTRMFCIEKKPTVKLTPKKPRYNYRCLDDTYEPDCLHCVWHKDCGDDIVYCSKPGALCVNARR